MLTKGFQIPFGVQLVNPLPVDAWSGPYTGLTEALSSIPIEIRYPTMEVRILSEAGNNIYWFKDGIKDSDLIPFSNSIISNDLAKVHKEAITENINGINTVFKLSNVFISGSVSVYLNGIREY